MSDALPVILAASGLLLGAIALLPAALFLAALLGTI